MYGSVLFGRGVAAVDGQKAIQQQILIEDDVGAAMRHDSRGKAAAGHHSGELRPVPLGSAQ